VVRGPVEFLMGSTKASDPDRRTDEAQHRVRIDRSFAIATREVTLAEYARFLDGKPEGVDDLRENELFKQFIPSAGCAIGGVTWYDAATYCNWLSAREGLPESQWCYPAKVGKGMKLPPDYLKRTGYRLPTEAEWEYACRAGLASSRPYGRTEERLGEFGWYVANSGRTMRPVGQKLPNDLGLFDIMSNAMEWCTDAYRSKLAGPPDKSRTDSIVDAEFSDQVDRVLRGGSYNDSAAFLRSAIRGRLLPSFQSTLNGFRPARTYP
jgi:formylglycine-generating enzyme required for sulfatase activity